MLSIETLEKTLSRLHSEVEAVECHGIISGLLVAKGEVGDAEVLALIAPRITPSDLLAQEAARELVAVRQAVAADLADVECDFEPLLPDESTELGLRLEALSDWVQGFIIGLAKGGVENYTLLPEEAGEFAQDLVEMAQLSAYELDEDEEVNETSYMELVEYLRAGVLLMNEVLHPTQAAPSNEQPTLH